MTSPELGQDKEAKSLRPVHSEQEQFRLEHSPAIQADLAAIQGPSGPSATGRFAMEQEPRREPLILDFNHNDPLAERSSESRQPNLDLKGLEDRIKQIEKQMVLESVPYIQQHGKDPEKEMVDSVKQNKVTFLGEIHTIGEPNPHREMVAKALKEMPPGSVLTTELPDVLKPVFDKFNASKPGSDFEIPDKLDGPYGKEALDLLHKVKDLTPDILDMWKAARDRGIKVEPIDNSSALMSHTDPNAAIENAKRDQHMKDDIMTLIKDNPNAHIIVEGGNLHAAHSATHDGYKPQTTAELLLADPEFKKDGGTLKSFYSQIASISGINTNMFAATFGIKTPLAVDTREGGTGNKVGPIPIFEDPGLNAIVGGQMSDFDEAIIYPFEEREIPNQLRSK